MEMTWAQFGNRVRSLTGSLAQLGCRRGGRVAILMRNLVENHAVDYAAATWARFRSGYSTVLAVEQIVYQVGHAEAEIVVTEVRYLGEGCQSCRAAR